MGILRDKYNGRAVTKRIPYVMFAQLDIAVSTNGSAFADSSFLHTIDKPFEIHRVSVYATAVDSSNIPTTAMTPNTQTFARVDILDTAANERLTKAVTRVENLVDNNTRFWEFDDPYVIEYQQGFTITGDNQNASTRLRIQVAFIGFLLKTS